VACAPARVCCCTPATELSTTRPLVTVLVAMALHLQSVMGLVGVGTWIGDAARSVGQSSIVATMLGWLSENVWHMAIAAIVLHVVLIGEVFGHRPTR
jgi:hypothetical protein